MFENRIRMFFVFLSSLIILISFTHVTLAAAQCTDNNGDGYNLERWCPPLDCDDTDLNVHPGAPEICDGKDSSCD